MLTKKKLSKLDFSRFLRLCGYVKLNEENGGLKQKVIQYLNQSFLETRDQFDEIFKKAKKEIIDRPLKKYRYPGVFEAAWGLTEIISPLLVTFPTVDDPEKSGLICKKISDDLVILSMENLDSLGLFKEDVKWEKDVWELYFSLSCWREAIRCVWAGIILHQLVLRLQGKRLLAETCERGQEKIGFLEYEMFKLDKPIGEMLSFYFISDEKADELSQLYEKSLWGSRFCETSAGENFKEFLRELNIDRMQRCGMKFEQAHAVLMAGSQRDPDLDIKLVWDQQISSYRFVGQIKNKDVHGFEDASKTASIPENILFEFIRQTDQKTQEDVFRLLIRGGWQKARDLVFPAIKRGLD